MVEVLGIAASIIAVLQLAGAVTSMGYNYLGGVKRASNDIQDVINELHSLSQVLVALKEFADNNPQSTALQKLNAKDGPLPGCAQELEVLKSTMEKKGTSGLKKMVDSLTWPLKEKETAQLLARIERHKSLFTFALTTDHISLSKAIEGYVQGTSVAIQDLQKYIHKERQKEDTIHALEKRKQALSWLDLEDFESKHLEISKRRQEGTGAWLLKSPGFLEWIRTTGARLLWGYGIPGAGKTFLISIVIDYIKDKASTSNSEIGLAYIYFDYQEQERQKPIHVLAKLLKQLLLQIPYLPTKIRELYEKREQDGKRPTFEELYTALHLVSNLFTKVFFVFDALDECHKIRQRKDLLPLFRRMGANGMNLFLASRPYPEDIQEALEDHDAAKIELVAKVEDIRVYIQKKIDENVRAKRLAQQNKDKIISDLTEGANGMFLLAHFNIEYLCQQTTVRKILTTLDRLKSSSETLEERPLDATYNLAMDQIRKQPKDSVTLAIKVLTWLAKAHRTLTINELQEAVSIEPGLYELDELDLPDKTTLIDVCAGLVIIDEKSGTIKLAHYTVQEYLLKYQIILDDADFRLATICTTFVLFDIFDEPCTSYSDFKDRLNSHPFLCYVAENLSSHLNSCDEDLTVEAILAFLRKGQCISSYCQARYFIGKLQSGTPPRHDQYLGGEPQLNIACALGHLTVVRLLLDQEVNILDTDSEGRTALHEAASEGHAAVVRLLLENGSDRNARDKFGEAALHKATLIQHMEIVQLLLEGGADTLVADNEGWTALHWAAYEDSEEIVGLLLEKGTDILASDNDGLTALHLAASQEHEGTVRLLLEKGADVLFEISDRSSSILHWAASRGYEGAVRLLLEGGADISVADILGWTTLHHAASEGHKGTVRLLLEKGADALTQCTNGCTALYLAARGGHEETVWLLLENGADISTRTVPGWTVFHGAAYEGHEGIVQLLLKKGADISAKDKLGWTALHYAASKGHERTVRLLLENGANILARCNNKCTVLYIAACGGNEKTVQLLLEKGADISTRVFRGWTILHGAAYEGNEGTARLLLKHGADTSAKDSKGWTPLHRAAFEGHEGVAKLLLANGADISAMDNKEWTPLHQAASEGREITVQLLLDNGADILATCNDEGTALYRAACRGHEGTVRLLLENGADISARAIRKWTILDGAADAGHEGTVKLLLENGADILALSNLGRTALHKAAAKGYEGTVKLLLENGAEISLADDLGWTALRQAVREGHTGTVKLLLENGANISGTDNLGWTALHGAADKGHEEVLELLLRNGADISATSYKELTALHIAVVEGHEGTALLLLKNGADIFAKEKTGRTPLSVALGCGSEAMIQLLEAAAAEKEMAIIGSSVD